jgi:acyl carrier protein phosphodiesterase
LGAKFKTLEESAAFAYFCPAIFLTYERSFDKRPDLPYPKPHSVNHLAHCFLSFGDEDLLLGNFIGDFVKGHDWEKYPRPVQRGILLHRAIDSFTDNHPLTDRSVSRIRSIARRYSPPFVDILYDHLLAIHWEKHSSETFEQFAAKTYAQLANRASEMPPLLQERLPKMLAGQFLHGYTQRDGLDWVLNRFSTRLSGQFDIPALSNAFFEQIDAFSEDFNGFFPDLVAHARHTLLQNR